MTALVYQTQVSVNDKITNYVDALYFTVTTLSTTGFGDITLVGNTGKLLSVAIMIFGISLFLRLVQVVLRPPKAHFPCPTCGLRRHDHDAVHCKACSWVVKRMKPRPPGRPLPEFFQPPKGSVDGEKVVGRLA